MTTESYNDIHDGLISLSGAIDWSNSPYLLMRDGGSLKIDGNNTTGYALNLTGENLPTGGGAKLLNITNQSEGTPLSIYHEPTGLGVNNPAIVIYDRNIAASVFEVYHQESTKATPFITLRGAYGDGTFTGDFLSFWNAGAEKFSVDSTGAIDSPTITSINADTAFLSGSVDTLTLSTSAISFPTQGLNSYHVGTLQDWITHTHSSMSDHGFELTNNGDGTVDISEGHVIIRDIGDIHSSTMMEYDIPSAAGITLTNKVTNYIWVYHNGGTPEITTTTSIPSAAGMSYSILYFIHRTDNLLSVVDMRTWGLDYHRANSFKDFRVHGYEHEPGGTTVTEDSTSASRYIDVSAGAFYLATVRQPHDAFNTTPGGLDSTFTTAYLSAGGGDWIRTSGSQQIDNVYYDDGTGTLANLANNNYGVHWLYLIQCAPDRLMTVYGTNTHATLAAAVDDTIPSTLPPECGTGSTSVLIAKIIVQQGNDDIVDVLSPFVTTFQGTSPTTHNSLGGIQGGTTNEHYHLTSAQHSSLANNAYGSIYVSNNSDSMDLSAAGSWHQVEDFTGEGPSLNTTPSSASDNITVGVAGDFQITCTVSISAEWSSNKYQLQVRKNGSPLDECIFETDASGIKVTGCLSGQVTLAQNDVITLWASCVEQQSGIVIAQANLNLHKL